jgi:hypothetical protein
MYSFNLSVLFDSDCKSTVQSVARHYTSVSCIQGQMRAATHAPDLFNKCVPQNQLRGCAVGASAAVIMDSLQTTTVSSERILPVAEAIASRQSISHDNDTDEESKALPSDRVLLKPLTVHLPRSCPCENFLCYMNRIKKLP